MGYFGTGQVPHRQGSATPFIAPYEAFPTTDGDLFIAAANDGAFAQLTDELGVPELTQDPRYRHNEDRVANRDELRETLGPRLLARPAAEWETLLHKRSVPCSRIRSVADLAADPQLDALGLLTALPYPGIPDLLLVDTPISIDAKRATHRLPPPQLGEHTDEILRSLGIDPTTLAKLRADRIVS